MGEQGDLDAVVELELLEHASDVRLDGRDAHVELAAREQLLAAIRVVAAGGALFAPR